MSYINTYEPLWHVKCAIEHTCLHSEEPCHGEVCMNHILAEVEKAMTVVRNERAMIVRFNSAQQHHNDIVKITDECFYDILGVLDRLHEQLRIPTEMNAARYKEHLKQACGEVQSKLTYLVNKYKELGVLLGPLIDLFYIR